MWRCLWSPGDTALLLVLLAEQILLAPGRLRQPTDTNAHPPKQTLLITCSPFSHVSGMKIRQAPKTSPAYLISGCCLLTSSLRRQALQGCLLLKHGRHRAIPRTSKERTVSSHVQPPDSNWLHVTQAGRQAMRDCAAGSQTSSRRCRTWALRLQCSRRAATLQRRSVGPG